MGYLVKASFNAEPRSYALDGIRTDVKAGLLPLTAMVREEKQDFWYSVGELIGERPVKNIDVRCGRCGHANAVREIELELNTQCLTCGAEFIVADPKNELLWAESRRVFFRAKLKMIAGGVLLFGAASLAWMFYSGALYLEDPLQPADQIEHLKKHNQQAYSYSYWGSVIRYVLPTIFGGAFLIQNGWSQMSLMNLKLYNSTYSALK